MDEQYNCLLLDINNKTFRSLNRFEYDDLDIMIQNEEDYMFFENLHKNNTIINIPYKIPMLRISGVFIDCIVTKISYNVHFVKMKYGSFGHR